MSFTNNVQNSSQPQRTSTIPTHLRKKVSFNSIGHIARRNTTEEEREKTQRHTPPLFAGRGQAKDRIFSEPKIKVTVVKKKPSKEDLEECLKTEMGERITIWKGVWKSQLKLCVLESFISQIFSPEGSFKRSVDKKNVASRTYNLIINRGKLIKAPCSALGAIKRNIDSKNYITPNLLDHLLESNLDAAAFLKVIKEASSKKHKEMVITAIGGEVILNKIKKWLNEETAVKIIHERFENLISEMEEIEKDFSLGELKNLSKAISCRELTNKEIVDSWFRHGTPCFDQLEIDGRVIPFEKIKNAAEVTSEEVELCQKRNLELLFEALASMQGWEIDPGSEAKKFIENPNHPCLLKELYLYSIEANSIIHAAIAAYFKSKKSFFRPVTKYDNNDPTPVLCSIKKDNEGLSITISRDYFLYISEKLGKPGFSIGKFHVEWTMQLSGQEIQLKEHRISEMKYANKITA